MTQDEIFKALLATFADIIPEVDLSAATFDDSLKELGANSIDRADIITETMEHAGVSLPMVSFAEAQSIGDIVRIIDGARS
ncbi:phosphopantetheine-binding protein [Streptomyces sp. 796.1]|uniref:phosphopantetheine-binding protein n=1 Tax=unclassified Streptomyces TaxID=2593676 RepID=UPI0032F03114